MTCRGKSAATKVDGGKVDSNLEAECSFDGEVDGKESKVDGKFEAECSFDAEVESKVAGSGASLRGAPESASSTFYHARSWTPWTF